MVQVASSASTDVRGVPVQELEARDLDAAFGAEIRGFDTAQLHDPATCAQLQALFDTRSVLLFRDLDLEHADQVRLVKQLAGTQDRALDGAQDDRAVEDSWYVSNARPNSAAPFGRLQFHSDMMWSNQPCEVLSLYAVDVEAPSVPTTFASAINAWTTLPDDLRARVDGRRALHTAAEIRRGDVKDVLVSKVEDAPSTVKPLDLPHPRTGETILYACEQMTKEVVDLPPDESEDLLEELFAHLYDPASLVHHEWRNGDLLVWDNLALQHARPNVRTDGPRRTLRKVASSTPKLSRDQRPKHSSA
jgi:alpha-ketoglutarate-dependent taurine dioxygenase